MIFEAKQITLKDGRSAILKTPCIEDAEKMLHYIKQACGETDFLARYPEEWEGVTAEQERGWVERLRTSPNALAIACYIDGEVVGNCEINLMSSQKTAHRASVHIAILRPYWGLGIGSAMFAELIEAAERSPRTEIVELEFLEGNTRAQALYEKNGFQIVGERPNAYKLRDGRVLKEFFMQRNIKRSGE